MIIDQQQWPFTKKDTIKTTTTKKHFRIITIQHQEAQKQQQKAWQDKNIKIKNISVIDLVLLYDSKIKGKPHKLETTWMGPYIIEDLNSNESV